jgi:hypothetical protein
MSTSATLPQPRPRDFALLWLAQGNRPARARARDQQADLAGEELRRQVFDHIASLDPDPDPGALESSLAAIAEQLGEPTGPTRAVCRLILDEWNFVQSSPGYWGWLLSEAVAAGDAPSTERRKRDSLG